MATYSGGDQIDRAQTVLDLHTVSSADGKCLACGMAGPCAEQERAARVFALALRLPRRVPGASRPELVGARRVCAIGLLRAS